MIAPTVTRPGRTANPEINDPASATTFWNDGVTTYVVAFGSNHATWQFIDEVDTLVAAIEAIRSGRPIDRAAFSVWLDTALKLNHRLTAVIDELLVYAREDDPASGRPWSWRDIAGDVEPHHTTLHERYGAALRRAGSSWRQWLLQGGPRAALLPAPPPPTTSTMIVASEEEAEVVLRAAGAEVVEREPADRNGVVHILARARDGRGLIVTIRPPGAVWNGEMPTW